MWADCLWAWERKNDPPGFHEPDIPNNWKNENWHKCLRGGGESGKSSRMEYTGMEKIIKIVPFPISSLVL